MLMTPKDKNESKQNRKGEDSSEEETARLLAEDPLDWMLKNEHVGNMLSVSRWLKIKSFRIDLLKPFKCFFIKLEWLRDIRLAFIHFQSCK